MINKESTPAEIATYMGIRTLSGFAIGGIEGFVFSPTRDKITMTNSFLRFGISVGLTALTNSAMTVLVHKYADQENVEKYVRYVTPLAPLVTVIPYTILLHKIPTVSQAYNRIQVRANESLARGSVGMGAKIDELNARPESKWLDKHGPRPLRVALIKNHPKKVKVANYAMTCGLLIATDYLAEYISSKVGV